jgi:hypothetical protein
VGGMQVAVGHVVHAGSDVGIGFEFGDVSSGVTGRRDSSHAQRDLPN